MTALLGVVWLSDAGRALREAFFMFWETLWALVLGFTLSGIVQAFVSRRSMRRALGDHRPASLVRATGYGMASSSCSYAAAAMARALVAKGADFISAAAFMFASTNLVVELGIVLVVLLGWQFAAAEFVGGPVMIGLLVVAGSVVFTRSALAGVQARVEGRQGSSPPEHEADAVPWRIRARSSQAWTEAAGHVVADARMLRRELLVGYLAAGTLAVVVPAGAWSTLFLHGHGWWTSVENALVGPLVAVVSCVCSIGNVPLAAALWTGGISFGGVVAFVFADLVALPMLLVYRRYYGKAFALRMFAVFYAVMALAGLFVGALFSGLGMVPAHRPLHLASAHFSWDATTWLDLFFLGVAAVVVWLHRRGRGRAQRPPNVVPCDAHEVNAGADTADSAQTDRVAAFGSAVRSGLPTA